MLSLIVKPPPISVQNNLQRILRHNNYRFVFYAYGTNQHNPPHYALHVYGSWNTLAYIYLSEYILKGIDNEQ